MAKLIRHGETGWSGVIKNRVVKGFQRELLQNIDMREKVQKDLIGVFVDASESFVKRLPDHEASFMPFVTGNLHDSIASVVSHKGRIVRASYTNPVATTTSPKTGKRVFSPTSYMGKSRIIGAVAAATMVRNMNGKFPDKLASTMLIGVPYSIRPQFGRKHAGYMNELAALYAWAMKEAFARGAVLKDLRWSDDFGLETAIQGAIELDYSGYNEFLRTEARKRQPKSDRANATKRRGRPKGSGGYMGSARPGMSMKMKP